MASPFADIKELSAEVFGAGARADADRQSDHLAGRLRSLIMTLELPPGAPLGEAELSARLGCGRTPLREALMRLADEKLVVVMPRRAVSVAPITVNDLKQIFEMRAILEVAAARIAAERATPESAAHIGECVAALESVADGSSAELVQLDFLFHFRLARASRNDYLADHIRRLLSPSMRFTFFADRQGVPIAPVRREHGAILAALSERNSEAAAAAMQKHIQDAKERILNAL